MPAPFTHRKAKRAPVTVVLTNERADAALAGLGSLALHGNDADRTPAPPGAELHRTSDQREQRVVLADAHAHAWVKVRAPLAHDDLAGLDNLATEPLDAKSLGVRVASVPAGRCTLFVCHVRPSSCWRWPCRNRCR